MAVSSDIETRLWIDGKFVESSDGTTFRLYSPATGEVVAEVHEASRDDANAAVAAAKAAFPSWSALSPAQRGVYLKKLADLLRHSQQDMARLEAMSMGRPVSTYWDAAAAAQQFDHYAESAWQAQGTSSLNTPGYVNVTFRQPYGVAAVIIPWNLPALFFAKKAAPALAAGNTVVLKSSEKAPLTSIFIASLLEKAGFPPGVLNIISGHGPLSGSVLSSHMDVRILTFTGSCRTGKIIMEAAAKSNLKEIILELGGKSPAIIFDDTNLDEAVEATKTSILFNSGQTCMANSRIYVQSSISDRFIEKFKTSFSQIQAGDPTDTETLYGPVADTVQFETVLKYLDAGRKSGEVAAGGGKLPGQDGKGLFLEPTIFIRTKEDAQVMKEEIFGPVVNINTFSSEREVLDKANDSEFGLYASVFTANINRAMRFAKALDAGTVAINCTSPTTPFDMPFGGQKQSGVGVEGLYHSLDNFLETKTVIVKVG
ncbi:aldehyde dehydrogenase [Dactylonectria macrodidyma]|uniref:aldehyde dehydrogenase (NAD(+)) n=1 Tax=Dactylonectria macrodidyma TaxID=307937 RepID=A0A9P9DYI4_9HYPO|nr:aldehyde dehydrogenase [Dactylonectria macrodidyma]